MSDEVKLEVTRGLPYARRFRVEGAASIWPTVEDLEVAADITKSRLHTPVVVQSLTSNLAPSIDGEDVVVDLTLTGEQTRALQAGVVDIVVSDPGPTDARAVSIPCRVVLSYLTTQPA